MSIVGWFFFKNNTIEVYYAWLGFAFATGIQLIMTLFQAIYIGSGEVSEGYKNIFFGTVAGSIAMIFSLYNGYSLWSLAIGSLFSSLIVFIQIYIKNRKIIIQIYKNWFCCDYSWGKEIIPIQAKYSLSFVAGYFAFQWVVLTPYAYVLFSPFYKKIQ